MNLDEKWFAYNPDVEIVGHSSVWERVVKMLDGWNDPLLRWLQGSPAAGIVLPLGGNTGIRLREIALQGTVCVSASCPILGTNEQIQTLLLDVISYSQWNDSIEHAQVVETINDSSDIVFLTFKSVYTAPIWIRPRSICVMRRWCENQEGMFVLTMKSVPDPSFPPDNSPIQRAHLKFGSFTVCPRNDNNGPPGCYVTFALHVNPAGFVTESLGYKQAFNQQIASVFLVSLRDYFDRQEYGMLKDIEPAEEPIHPMLETPSPNVVSPLERTKMGTLDPMHWSESRGENFPVRGASYLETRRKIRSQPSLMNLVAVDLFALPNGPIENIAAQDLRRFQLAEEPEDENSKWKFFIMQLQIRAPTHYALVFYFRYQVDSVEKENLSPERRLLKVFEESTDEYRNQHFKLIPRVVDGVWWARKAVGSDTPVILGSKIALRYYITEDYTAVDCDVGSSQLATKIVELVKGQSTNMVIDLAILLQGNDTTELPERILGVVRLNKVNLKSATIRT